jgi:hypothetical protein
MIGFFSTIHPFHANCAILLPFFRELLTKIWNMLFGEPLGTVRLVVALSQGKQGSKGYVYFIPLNISNLPTYSRPQHSKSYLHHLDLSSQTHQLNQCKEVLMAHLEFQSNSDEGSMTPVFHCVPTAPQYNGPKTPFHPSNGHW